MLLLKEFQKKYKVNENLIFETEYWIWSLRPHQATLGAGILSPRRECTAFSELNVEEFKDLNSIIKVIEQALKKAFNYDAINYLMLMMFEKHVHYHILPRYNKPVEFVNYLWNDESWPRVPKLIGEPLSQEKLAIISSVIKGNINI